jgi:hypothetical protein
MPSNYDALNWRLVAVSETDFILVRDAVEGIFICGAPGSGKSSNVGKQHAIGLLSAPHSGALILTAKAEETAVWQQYAKDCGREDDLIVFNEKSGHTFDPIAYEWYREGRGAGDNENLIDFFSTLVSLGKKEVGQGHDPFWERGNEQLMRNVIKLLDLASEPISIVSIDRCIKSLPTAPDMHEDETWQQESYCAQLIDSIKARKDSLTPEQWSDLDFATQFIFKKWPAFDERPRSSLEMTWSGMADKFLFNPFNRIFCSGKCTITPEMTTHDAKIIIVDFPLLEYGFETARLMQVIIKLTFQRAWLRRNLADSGNLVFLWQDEFQYFVTRRDNFFQQTCRGSRVAVICLTQNILNLAEELGEQQPGSKTKSFLGNLGLKIFLQQNDIETCNYASDQIGREYRFIEGYSGTATLDHHNAGISGSRQLTHVIEPIEFTRLLKPNSSNPLAEAIVYASGRTFNASKTAEHPAGRKLPPGAVLPRNVTKGKPMQKQTTPLQNGSNQTIEQYQDTAMNIAYNVASIFTMPVEIFIRPHFGSQYFFVLNPFLSGIMLSLAAAFTTVAVGVGQMIPFVHLSGPIGVFGLGSLLAIFFLASIVHGLRLWRRMIFMELEDISTREGTPLPFFKLIPKGDSQWICRIFYEPIFVWMCASVLSTLLIIQAPLSLYLHVAALCLAMKNYIAWYKNWSYIRNLMDVANAAPIVAKILSNTATDEEKSRVHLASLPKNLPPDIRKATMAHIARAYSVPTEEEKSHD